MKPWYQRPMRIAALQCNFEEGKTLAVADRWREIGFNVEQVFHPTADCYSALFDAKKHGRLLKRYLQRLKKNGIRAILYLNVHILGPSLAHHKDDWAQRSADGKFPMLYETYYAVCVNSPWREHYFQVLRSLAPFPIDGVFLDGPVVVGNGCHCPHCREKFRREEGREMAANENLAEFSQRSLDGFLRESYRLFKQIKPDGVHYMNLGVMHLSASKMRLPDALEYNDILGTEGGFMFYGPPKEAYLFKPSVTAKVLEAVAPNKPRVIFMAADQKSWSWLMHQPAETKLCVASSVANGANIWYGLHGSTKLLNTPGGRAGSEIIQFLKRHEDVLDGTVSAARVAVMYSLATERNYRTSAEQTDFYGQHKEGKAVGGGNFTESFNGVCEMLARSSVPFDVVTDLEPSAEKFCRYDCIILPTSACLDDATISALREFVAHGGNLIGLFDSSLFDENGKARKNFGLANVFGVTFGGEILALKDFNYFQPTRRHPIWKGLDIPLFPAPRFGLTVRPVRNAVVLGRFLKPLAGRYVELTAPGKPAIVLHRFGQGQSLYFAGTFGEMAYSHTPPEYRRIFENAVTVFSKREVIVQGGLGNIELVVRRQAATSRQSERLILHLVNYAGIVPRPFVKVCPQEGVQLRLKTKMNARKVKALAAGCNCRVQCKGGALIINVPRFDEYEIIVVE